LKGTEFRVLGVGYRVDDLGIMDYGSGFIV
jgi:hypothetical protein